MDTLTPIRQFWEDVWTRGDVDFLADLFSKEATQNGEPLDIEAFGTAVSRWREIFPDFRVEIDELLPIAENRVVSRVTYTGTQKLPWCGLPAGQSFRTLGIDIFRMKDGRITELWHTTDHYDAILQLGGKIVPK
jgi:steroid delta-isomerase-like uncharacterized protein